MGKQCHYRPAHGKQDAVGAAFGGMESVHAALMQGATYPKMDMESRAYYRSMVSKL